MKIAILTYGSQGDVEPFVALGHALCSAGHQVSLAGPEAYQSRFDFNQIRFTPLPGDPSHLVQELVDQAGTSRIQMVLSMGKFVIPLAVQVFERSRAACQGADLILHSFLLTGAGIGFGKELGVPTISAQLFPVFCTTSAFPAPTFPDLPLGDGYRRLTHALVSQIFKWGSRSLYRRVRRKNPQLPALTDWLPGDHSHHQTPILYGFSPHVVPKPADWGQHSHLTGYWILKNVDQQKPSRELVDFLQAGPEPITIAFGSTQSSKLGEIIDKIGTALSRCNQRGVIVSEKVPPGQTSPDLFRVGYAPYDWLFQHSSAVIHHGGAGTTARGLRAGVPNIILPFTSDQPFWGRQVHALGAGPAPIPANKTSVNALTTAIDLAQTDTGIRSQAEKIGRRLREENGTQQALKLIENYHKRFKIEDLGFQ